LENLITLLLLLLLLLFTTKLVNELLIGSINVFLSIIGALFSISLASSPSKQPAKNDLPLPIYITKYFYT